jgi:hypothetical protein
MAAESNVAGCIVFGFGIAIASGLGESKLGILTPARRLSVLALTRPLNERKTSGSDRHGRH